MTPFRAVSARAVAIDRANVDTDVLIPINRLIGTPPAELKLPPTYSSESFTPSARTSPSIPLLVPPPSDVQFEFVFDHRAMLLAGNPPAVENHPPA